MFLLSFPTRERGLKFPYDISIVDRHMSFPTREKPSTAGRNHIDTCLTAQDRYKIYLDYFRIAY